MENQEHLLKYKLNLKIIFLKKEFEKILKITERAKKVLYNNMELDEIEHDWTNWRIKKKV